MPSGAPVNPLGSSYSDLGLLAIISLITVVGTPGSRGMLSLSAGLMLQQERPEGDVSFQVKGTMLCSLHEASFPRILELSGPPSPKPWG